MAMTLSDAEVRILSRLAAGEHTFRPSSSPDHAAFDVMVEQLKVLASRGLIRLPENRISRRESGAYMMVGPCDLTAKGKEALERDLALGPRNLEG
jgi:hypothetical protein